MDVHCWWCAYPICRARLLLLSVYNGGKANARFVTLIFAFYVNLNGFSRYPRLPSHQFNATQCRTLPNRSNDVCRFPDTCTIDEAGTTKIGKLNHSRPSCTMRRFRFIPHSARHPLLRITRTGPLSTPSNRASTVIQGRHQSKHMGPVAYTKSAAWAPPSARSSQSRNQ